MNTLGLRVYIGGSVTRKTFYISLRRPAHVAARPDGGVTSRRLNLASLGTVLTGQPPLRFPLVLSTLHLKITLRQIENVFQAKLFLLVSVDYMRLARF